MSLDFKIFIGGLVGLIALLLVISYVDDYNERARISPTRAITNNLRQIAAAGQQYILEEGVSVAYYNELEGEYFARIKSVDDERYDDLVVYDNGGVLRVTTTGGMEAAFTY